MHRLGAVRKLTAPYGFHVLGCLRAYMTVSPDNRTLSLAPGQLGLSVQDRSPWRSVRRTSPVMAGISSCSMASSN